MMKQIQPITTDYLVHLAQIILPITGDLASVTINCECITDADKTKLIKLQQQLLECSEILLNASRRIKNAPQRTKGV